MGVRRTINLRDYTARWGYPNGHDVDFLIDERLSGDALPIRIAKNLEAIHDQAIGLLTSFMKDSGEFSLNWVHVAAETTRERGDFTLSFSFTSDRDENEYAYTRFDVYFLEQRLPARPFWPIGFSVAFE